MKPLKTELDIYSAIKSSCWQFVQGDINAYHAELTIMEHSNPYDMSEGIWTATITWMRANNTIVLTGLDKITINGNVLKYTVESNVYAVGGALVASVELFKDGSRLTTCQFTARVREQISDGTEIPTQDEYLVLMQLLEQVNAASEQALVITGTLQGWVDNPEQFIGAKGDTGEGLNILGTLIDTSYLPPMGVEGNAYLINGHLFVWLINVWVDVGVIQGPQGATGLQGIPGNTGAVGYTPVKGIDYFDGTNGTDGASAYESAVVAGYIGTEVDFNADLAAIEGLASELGGI